LSLFPLLFLWSFLCGLVPVTFAGTEAAEGKTKDAGDAAAPSPETLARWLEDLQHPDLARREAAARGLIAAGEEGAKRVLPLCGAADEALALRALRVFSAVHGVPPQVYSEVREAIARAEAERGDVAAEAKAIAALGPSAESLAARLLASRGERPSRLGAEIAVRRALRRVADGEDRGDRAHASVLALGTTAAPALERLLREPEAGRGARTHAVWLYAQVTGADRARGLAPLLKDDDRAVRQEAALAAVETLRAADFPLLAGALGTRSGIERQLLADAAARKLSVAELTGHLSSPDAAAAALAASVLGMKREKAALEALAGAISGPAGGTPGGSELAQAAREAAAEALGRYDDEKSAAALASLYTGDKSPSVRAAALSSLRHQAGRRQARIALTAALLDEDAGVRLQAADALAGLAERLTAPALVQALRDESTAVRGRARSGLESLFPDGPRLESAGAEGGRDRVLESWREWLGRKDTDFKGDDLPWYKAAKEAAPIVGGVRSYIRRSFFHFGKKDLVETAALNKAALDAMKAALREDGSLKAEGLEKRLLERLLDSPAAGDPEAFLAALGAVPFETKVSDLVRLTNAAADGMVRSLGDRFSRLILSNDPEGKVKPDWLPGLLDDSDTSNGFIVGKKDEVQVIDFVLWDSPAFYAGFKAGDQLVKIGDKFTSEMSPREVNEAIAKEGEFSILRDGWTRPYAFRLKPALLGGTHIVERAVLPGGIGYVRLKMFDVASSVELERALKELEGEGLKGLVFDLRNNPGGTVIDATEIVDKFLPAGKVITSTEMQGKEGSEGNGNQGDAEIRSTDAGTDRDYPLVVLVNRSSASASEMTSGSLQGNKRAKVIGETTFGKGIGQSAEVFDGFSSETALGESRSVYVVYLTMMRYYVPEGRRSVHHVGVEPDLPVEERELRGSALDRVMRVRQGKPFAEYVDLLLKNHRDAAIEVAILGGTDPGRYPEFAAFHESVKGRIEAEDALRLVREELRRRLLVEANETKDDALFRRLFYDLEEDRVLQAGIREVAGAAGIDLEGVETYRRIGLK
jgi:C-terminal peptidase prc